MKIQNAMELFIQHQNDGTPSGINTKEDINTRAI
jgi:hypothetical protein